MKKILGFISSLEKRGERGKKLLSLSELLFGRLVLLQLATLPASRTQDPHFRSFSVCIQCYAERSEPILFGRKDQSLLQELSDYFMSGVE